MLEALLQANLPDLKLHARGKVRDIYAVDDQLLLIATDRISAFDHILASGIPDKGKLLTQISLFWFDLLKDLVPNHLITADINLYPPSLQPYREILHLRSMLVQRVEIYPIECVVRGYLAGSAWKDYQETGRVCGVVLPKGMVESERLPEPLFSPATKAPMGEHDMNISMEEMGRRIGHTNAELLRDLSLMIYDRASRHVDKQELILADTKFEFGNTAQGVMLADEVLTPDSSRYWPKKSYSPGGPQISFDKQFVRDYLVDSHWNKQAPAPGLPEDVIARTQEKYLQAFRRITGRS
ncbi:MAG: phosphoribosylaminoimidazolesuccinocarboxamide synthase [Acidobacteriaceae bacterium]